MPASIVANSLDSPPLFLEICPPLPLSLPLPFTLAFTFPRCMYIATLRFHPSTCRTATFPSSFFHLSDVF
ncbi:hypothetical protein J007_00863 [Cryptococcus neoformans]|nr:hypothetical protein J007_00863 [Cryptococcus neoformans var. grubii]OXC64676.1 hypothetical protein C358_00864 [Cryptococcus neoformans var. grubii MW-RSA852]